jgi:hypothetical protein
LRLAVELRLVGLNGDQVMPLYFFHLSFGQRTVLDEEGVELPNRLAARDEALAIVRDLVNPEIGDNSRRWASWFIEVADEEDAFFRTPIGHPALEVVTPHAHGPRAEEPALQPLRPAAMAALPEVTATRAQTAEIIRQRAASHRKTAQLLKANEQLRRELSDLCLAIERIRRRTSRVVLLARAGGGTR